MKIEMDDNSATVTGLIGVALIIGIGCISGCHICEQTKKDAIKAGLVQKIYPASVPHWIKPETK